MLRRRIALLIAAFSLFSIAPALAQEDPQNVPAGVSAGGVDLSGATLEEATARLATTLAARFARPVQVGVAGKLFVLSPEESKFAFDSLTTAKRAIRAKAPGPVPLAITHSRLSVRAFVSQVNAKMAKRGRDARIKIGLRKLFVRGARHGRAIDQTALAAAIDAALDDEAAPRALRAKLVKVRPKVTLAVLKRRYNTVLTIDKANFKLRLFKGFKLRKSYGIAHGQPAYPTPSGRFAIQNKQVNPTWSVPNSPWAGELAGTSVQGGSAANPLKARWMGIANGVGIHGTGEEWSIGSRASHGCIRMRVADVIDLYPRVPVGTPVLIR
jgi:lipoprotein-anchoring transpeptidase ErfK/SrfK